MVSSYDVVVQLTSGALSEPGRSRALNDFSDMLGWRPSFQFPVHRELSEAINAHLIVEHGLENSAVLSFLKSGRREAELSTDERRNLLSLAYNNLVDWHIFIERDQASFQFVRNDPLLPVTKFPIGRPSVEQLRSQAFEAVLGRAPNPNLPSLDDALIHTISFWKRSLSAELGYSIANANLSALFNAIIFVRAVEDEARRTQGRRGRGLLDQWETLSRSLAGRTTPRQVILNTLSELSGGSIPPGLVDELRLAEFDRVASETAREMFENFYRNKYAPYSYDFSVMSKHALSRIYEHYVSTLRLENTVQASFFPQLPEEEWTKAYGSVYTPQFVARFFAQFLREQMPPAEFRGVSGADLASGSGIFLRTLLELQCDPVRDGVTSETIRSGLFTYPRGRCGR